MKYIIESDKPPVNFTGKAIADDGSYKYFIKGTETTAENYIQSTKMVEVSLVHYRDGTGFYLLEPPKEYPTYLFQENCGIYYFKCPLHEFIQILDEQLLPFNYKVVPI